MTLPDNRPVSWNTKMLSGAPLITDEQFEKLLANAPKSLAEMETHDPVPVVKIFLPHIQWILVHVYLDDLDRAFAVVQMGNNKPEAGDVRISDIAQKNIVYPERDKYTKLDKPWSYYLSPEADAWS